MVIFSAFKNKIQQIRQAGTLRTIVSKFIHIINREGWRGIVFRFHRLGRNDYSTWIKAYDTPANSDLERMRKHQRKFRKTPIISVIMPVFNSNPAWLKEALDSVIHQVYTNWELCIADDASTSPEIGHILTSYQERDPRIKVCFRKTNGHIAACSNSALEIATGEWIALLDHDDKLSPKALFMVVDAINRFPHLRLIYSDEDKLDESGKRSDPYFKSNWNPDLFYSHNMLSHLGVYHEELVKRSGGFREGFEGSQDYDLALRCIEHITADQIYHIPMVLYHWRKHNQSTAFSANTKPYAMLAGERSLNEHFQRIRSDASAELIGYGYRVRYALPRETPMVSIIIPTRNCLTLLRACIESIQKKTIYPDYEIIIVDNGSNDSELLDYLRHAVSTHRNFKVVRIEGPFNHSELNNAAVKLSNGDFIVFLNNDVTVISPEWLTEMMGLAIQQGVGAVGSKLYYPDGRVQHAGVVLGLGSDRIAGCAHNGIEKNSHGYFGRASLINSFSAVTAACMLVKKEIFEHVGGFDEVNLPVSYNDVDICLRIMEAGYRNVFTPYAELYHHESSSRGRGVKDEGQERSKSEKEYFRKRWSYMILQDPSYNPNLTLDFPDFSLAWPPRIDSFLPHPS